MMKKLNSNKGFTLVEILVSMTIFSIMAVLFLNVFFASFLISNRAEARTATIGEVAGSIETKISTDAPTGTPSSVTLDYSGGVTNTAGGIFVTESKTNSENQTVTLEYFIPEED